MPHAVGVRGKSPFSHNCILATKNSEIKIFSAKMWQNKSGTFSPVCDFIVKNDNFLMKICHFIILIFNEIFFNTS